MKSFFLSTLLVTLLFHHSKAQTRYSLGTDYALLMFYPQKYFNVGEYAFLYGIVATKEISLKSNLVLGAYYYQISTVVGQLDSLSLKNKYVEVPISLKTHFKMFDKAFRWHMNTGIGVNMLLSGTKIARDNSQTGPVVTKEGLKPDAMNLFWGIGFDIKINQSFYISIDSSMKCFYFFSTKVNDSGNKISLSPLSKAGIFVWLNKR